MNPPLHDDPTFPGMLEFRPGVPQSSAMDQSSAGGSAITNSQSPLDQQFMDIWQYQQAILGQEVSSTANGMQQPSHPLPFSGAHAKPMMYEDASQTNAAYHDDTTFAHYPMFQQMISSEQPYRLPFTSHPLNAAGTTAANGHARYQPPNDSSHMGFASGLSPSSATYDNSFNHTTNAPAVHPVGFGGALNMTGLPQTSTRTLPFQEDTGLSGLAQAQDFISWINHQDNSGETMSSHVPTAMSNEATAASNSFAYGQMPGQSIWQNSPLPFNGTQGVPGPQVSNGSLPQFQQHAEQNQSALQLQMQTSASPITIQVPANNATLNDNSTNTMQVQPDNLMPSDECMQLYIWSREAYPDASESAFSMPNQHTSSSNHAQQQYQHTNHPQPTELAQQASLRGPKPRVPTFAVPAPRESQTQHDTRHSLPKGRDAQHNVTLPQAVAHHPSSIFRQNPAPLESHAQAADNSQFMTYAMPAPGKSPNIAQESLMGRSEAYHQHTAIAGKLEILALETNPSHSAGILPNLELYLTAASRYAAGERKIIIHTPRVGQKSYGTEKRFLCPPPTASILGLPWWQPDDNGNLRPPAINISITGEQSVPSSTPFWTTIQNKVYEETAKLRLTTGERPFLGKVSNKGLHVSDGVDPKEDKKGRTIKAKMVVNCREQNGRIGQEIGSFESKEIKIVSKPSKKRSSARASDLFLQHGSLVTLYNRIKAQTSSTRFLAVGPNLRQIRGSDGKPLPIPSEVFTTENGFVADANSWDPFAIWLVDPNKPQGRPKLPATPTAPFPPPSDAISIPSSKVVPIICFNNTVRLQCQTTGLITPVMVIRKIEGPQTVQAFEGARKDNDMSKCAVGELPSDPVCQLHKIAFELYTAPVAPLSPVYGSDIRSPGTWLSCDQEAISFRPGISARNWTTAPSTPPSRGSLSLSSSLPPSPGHHMSGLQPMTPRSVVSNTLPSTPASPVILYSPSFVMSGGQTSGGDYFMGARHNGSGSTTPYILNSPLQGSAEDQSESSGPGPTRRRQASSGASIASNRPSSTPMMRPPMPRKRGSQQSLHAAENKKESDADGPLWTIDIAENATWTIVGAESKSYTFWIPPHIDKLTCPVTPFPTLNKLVPPGQAADSGLAVDKRYVGTFTSLAELPLATFYGSGLSKKPDGDPLQVIYYGNQAAKHNEVRCQEVMSASVPDQPPPMERGSGPLPIFLVKTNGECIYPTSLTWQG